MARNLSAYKSKMKTLMFEVAVGRTDKGELEKTIMMTRVRGDAGRETVILMQSSFFLLEVAKRYVKAMEDNAKEMNLPVPTNTQYYLTKEAIEMAEGTTSNNLSIDVHG